VLFAREKVDEERARVELPLLLARLVRREDLFEERLALVAMQEVILIGRLFVRITRREHHPVDAERRCEIEKLLNFGAFGVVEDRRVRRDAETTGLGRLDRLDRDVERPGTIDRAIVDVADAVEMDAERQVRRRRELIEALLEPKRVGAEVDELLALDDLRDDLFDLRMQQRLAAGNG